MRQFQRTLVCKSDRRRSDESVRARVPWRWRQRAEPRLVVARHVSRWRNYCIDVAVVTSAACQHWRNTCHQRRSRTYKMFRRLDVGTAWVACCSPSWLYTVDHRQISQVLSSSWDRDRLASIDMGRKLGVVPFWGEGELCTYQTQCGQGRGLYVHAKFHLDPSNRLAIMHRHYRQADRTGQDRQRSDSIGEPFYKRSPKNATKHNPLHAVILLGLH